VVPYGRWRPQLKDELSSRAVFGFNFNLTRSTNSDVRIVFFHFELNRIVELLFEILNGIE